MYAKKITYLEIPVWCQKGPWWLTTRAELVILCIFAGVTGENRRFIFFLVDQCFYVCHMCKVFYFSWQKLFGIVDWKWKINICGRSSNSAWLIPRLVTCTCMHKDMTLEPEKTHHVFFRRADTPSPPSICMQSTTAAWQPAAELLRYAVCLGGSGGRDGGGVVGVGAWVGSGSKLLEDIRRAEPGSCLAVSALRRSLAVYTDPANPRWGQRPYLGRGLRIQEHTQCLSFHHCTRWGFWAAANY